MDSKYNHLTDREVFCSKPSCRSQSSLIENLDQIICDNDNGKGCTMHAPSVKTT